MNQFKKCHRLPVYILNALFLIVGFSSGYFYSLHNISPDDPKNYFQDYNKQGDPVYYSVQLRYHDPKIVDNLNGIISSVENLAKRLTEDDPQAIQLLFDLLKISDGSAAESIHMQLGQIIKRNPALFLELLDKNYSAPMHLSGIAGNLGPDFVDEPTKDAIETRKRIEAIRSVKDKKLEKIKEKVLKSLQSGSS